MLFIPNTLQLFLLLLTVLSTQGAVSEFIESPNNQTKFIGEEAEFNCTFRVTDNGAVMIHGAQTWEYKLSSDDTFLLVGSVTEGHNFTLLTDGVSLGHSALILDEVSIEYHNLAIKCSHLSLSSTAYLFVYSPPKLNLTNAYFEVIEYQTEPLTVIFSTGGYPDPIYSERFDWFHNGVLLTETESIILSSVSLRLTDPLRSHAGTYSLTTYTENGNATAGFFINVTYPPEIDGVGIPGISQRVIEEFSVLGENIILSCGENIQGNPTPIIVWSKLLSDNTTLPFPSNTNTLSLSNISLSHTGIYACDINNPLGSIAIRINLTVYAPAVSPLWEDSIAIGATGVVLVWKRPIETYGLVVEYYELVVNATLDSSVLVQQRIEGQYTNYSISYENGIEIYPDTQYTAQIRAYTYNGTIKGENSFPLRFKTLQSPPILHSITPHINTTGITIQWLLYSSGKANSPVNFYFIKYRKESSDNSTFIVRVKNTSFTLKIFDSHSTYIFTVYGSRNGSNGIPIETQIDTMGYGVPPTPLMITTSNTEIDNITNVTITFKQVPTPFIVFRIFISCQQQQINSSQRQIIISNRDEINFFGGNLTLSLSPTNIYFAYNCSLKLSNIFANSTYPFRFLGSKYGQVTRITTSATTTTTTTTTRPQTPNRYTAFYIAIIVVLTILSILILIMIIIIIIIIYAYYRRYSYAEFQTAKLGDMESKNGDQIDTHEYKKIRKIETVREEVPCDTICRSTSM